MKSFSGIAVVAVVVICLVSCSSGEEKVAPELSSAPNAQLPVTTEQTTTTEQSTTTTAPPSPGDVYLALVAPRNCQADIFNAARDEVYGNSEVSPSDWPNLQLKLLPAYQAMATADVAFLEGLGRNAWPALVQPQIDGVMAELSKNAALEQSLADAKSYEEFLAIRDAPANQPSVDNPAAAVRAKLGIASNVNNSVDECKKLSTP